MQQDKEICTSNLKLLYGLFLAANKLETRAKDSHLDLCAKLD